MDSKIIPLTIKGSGARQCTSWIESFVDYASNLESAPIFRKWSAIAAIAATLEQKVWVDTGSPLYPNLYIFLVGPAGVGKSRIIHSSTNFIRKLPEMFIGPTSVTMAHLVDIMAESKRQIPNLPDPMIEYNTVYIVADEIGAFMHKYEDELIAGLTTFYDCGPYSQGRRTKDIRIKIARPQLSILAGSTPSNLMEFVPEAAWGQGFMSRVILVYSEEKHMVDIFNTPNRSMPEEMIHDLKIINTLRGGFAWTEDYAKAVYNWQTQGFPVKPTHPRLEHYSSRRRAQLLKLSMISSVDRDDKMTMTVADFNRALGWLLEAEERMPQIFEKSTASMDSQAMDEIYYFVKEAGTKGISEHRIVNFARTRIQYSNNIIPVLKTMEVSGLLIPIGIDPKTGLRIFIAGSSG